MSLENNLKRIADALEALVAQGNMTFAEKAADAGLTDAVGSVEQTRTAAPAVAAPAPAAPAPAPAAPAAPAPASAPAPAPAPAPAVAVVAAPAAAPAPAATAALTPEQMNTELVAEFKRLGNRRPIDDAMVELGVTTVTGLSAEKQQELLAKVRAIQS